jgi:anhydro-N-acetylmuramic acid kinase
MDDRYIGLMSGTSMDGVDGVLAWWERGALRVLAHAHRPFDDALRAELVALNAPGENELHRAALAANGVARAYAEVVHALRDRSPGPVRAIGAHGQTVRHRPGEGDGTGYTLQLNAPALLAELTATAVVADFRSRDLAAGGQAAPLVPAFHHAQFAQPGHDRVVVNIGGIANLTFLPAAGPVRGHDCGPGNGLMDAWSQRHLGCAYDAAGNWAAGGRVLPALLGAARAHPFFVAAPPKSTGRDDFHLRWLDALLGQLPEALPQDVQSTLCELTAVTVAQDIGAGLPGSGEVIVCGGGALNCELIRRLRAHLPGRHVTSSEQHGLPPMQVEATAFAWLARSHVAGEPGNLASVTGARGPRVLGALYPA